MKKIVASVGLVALGASTLQAASSSESGSGSPSPFSSETAKWWNVSATIRGFYDDNINTAPDDASIPAGYHRGSTGFEVMPKVWFNWPLEQTTIGLSYLYSMKYYENKPYGNTDHIDQSHTVGFALDHQFNERFSLSVRDSFVIGQEPDMLRAGNTFSTFQRIPGDNIRNSGSIIFNAQLAPKWALEAGYANAYYNYADDTVVTNNNASGLSSISASRSGYLDRIEQLIHLDARWQVQPSTVGVLGYQLGLADYTADQLISGSVLNTAVGPVEVSPPLMADVRNSRSHYIYVGVDQTFRPDLSGSVRGGARYNDYYNDPYDQNAWSPYGLLSARYTYMEASYVELGFSYDRNATDLFSVQRNSITTDAQSANLWLTMQQRITPKFSGSLTAQLQNSNYDGGAYNNENDTYFLVGLNLKYQFDRHFSAEVGYNYDLLCSDMPNRGFDRNRVYLGLTAAY